VLGVFIFCKKHDVAASSAWVDNICATPNIVCSEVKGVIIFEEDKIASITVVGGAINNIIEDHSQGWMPWMTCSLSSKHILYVRKDVVPQLYEEVLLLSCQ
jgi:hypothetical protein